MTYFRVLFCSFPVSHHLGVIPIVPQSGISPTKKAEKRRDDDLLRNSYAPLIKVKPSSTLGISLWLRHFLAETTDVGLDVNHGRRRIISSTTIKFLVVIS